MIDKVDEFNSYRAKMNDKILSENNKVLKRIFNLDTNAFTEGALDKKTKELLGLVASTVLRCDDCVKYHLESSHKEGITREEIMETLSIGTLIGGTIVIPHLRRALNTGKLWKKINKLRYNFCNLRYIKRGYEITC